MYIEKVRSNTPAEFDALTTNVRTVISFTGNGDPVIILFSKINPCGNDPEIIEVVALTAGSSGRGR